jgi:hypothetical protein
MVGSEELIRKERTDPAAVGFGQAVHFGVEMASDHLEIGKRVPADFPCDNLPQFTFRSCSCELACDMCDPLFFSG